jgi:hypothetical protein
MLRRANVGSSDAGIERAVLETHRMVRSRLRLHLGARLGGDVPRSCVAAEERGRGGGLRKPGVHASRGFVLIFCIISDGRNKIAG